MRSNRFLYWSAQLGGWMSYGLLIFLATYANDPNQLNFKLFLSLALFLCSGIGITHLMRTLFIKWGFLDLKLTPLIPRILLFSVVGASFMALINLVATYYIEGSLDKDFKSLNLVIDILALSVLFTLWNAIYFTYHFFRKSIRQEMHVLQMQASQNEIELKSLRSQINPHFLFNSLNSIRALIDIEPKAARESVTKLSNLLRTSLLHGKHPFVSIEEEIELVKNYLDIEKIRFEERLRVEWKIDPTAKDANIPPFLIHTQVENAIKHGISKIIEGGRISIEVQKTASKGLDILIRNTGYIDKSKPETGIGIENTLRRLDLQYHGKAHFKLIEQDGDVLCSIQINDK
ncbi:MAG: histidine kinase [Bacteroidetes bacterium]|nr:MAG: histidine kinase [Bacteroidota bacterium]